MKIILCYPPNRHYEGYGQDTRWLPLGIASIGAYIKKEIKNIDIVLLDLFKESLNDSIVEIEKHMIEDDINIIGFTCLTEQRISVFELSEKLKENHKNIITVIGGSHASIMADQINKEYTFIDHIVKGEGEKAFKFIVKQYQNKSKNIDKIIEFEPIKDLSELPHAIDGFSLFKTKIDIQEASIVFSRGCTDYCTFCSTTKFWKGYRSRNATDVFQEMMKFYVRYNFTHFKFQDDACTANIENLKDLCKLIIETNHNNIFTYEITARADQFDKELIKLLKKSGCIRIAVGIESGSEKMRKSMNKNLDINKAKENIKLLLKEGIEVGLLLIVAYPNESDKTIKETIDFIRDVKPSVTYKQPLMVFPGTKVYRDLVKLNWIDDSYWLKDLPQPYYTKEQNWNTINKWIMNINNASRKLKVLLFVPCRQKENIFKKHIESLNNLKIPDYVELNRLFLLHNSTNLKKYLNENDIIQELKTDEEYKTDENTHYWKNNNLQTITNIKNSLISNRKLLDYYDYIFMVDSDLVLHKLTLESLLESNKDIVSEIFWTDWKNSGSEEPNAWDFDHYSFIQDTMYKFRQKGLYQCGGTGACILISTKVYKSGVNYSPIPNISFWGEDRAFSIRAYVAGFDIWVDTNYPAIHLYRESDLQKLGD